MQEQGSNSEASSSSFFQAFDSTTTRLSGGAMPSVPRKEISFVIDHETIGNGLFESDFRITLMALSHGQEVQASRQAQGDTYAMSAIMAKMAVSKVDEKSVSTAQREFLWSALGPDGRNLVMLKYSDMMLPSEEAKKKADETLRVG